MKTIHDMQSSLRQVGLGFVDHGDGDGFKPLVEPDPVSMSLDRIEADLKAMHALLVGIADAMGLNDPPTPDPDEEEPVC